MGFGFLLHIRNGQSPTEQMGMVSADEPSRAEPRRIAENWLSAFSEALKARNYERVARMMHADCYWRDLLTFSWDFKTLHGVDEVKSWLFGTFDAVGTHGFRLEGEPTI